MLTYFLNRGGRGLSPSHRAALESAKKLLSEGIRDEKDRDEKERSRPQRRLTSGRKI
jgi:hypothetical protein